MPSVTVAEKVLKAKTCSICEAIRERRPVRGHVVRYLDQLGGHGEADEEVFFPADRERLPLSDKERKVIAVNLN